MLNLIDVFLKAQSGLHAFNVSKMGQKNVYGRVTSVFLSVTVNTGREGSYERDIVSHPTVMALMLPLQMCKLPIPQAPKHPHNITDAELGTDWMVIFLCCPKELTFLISKDYFKIFSIESWMSSFYSSAACL